MREGTSPRENERLRAAGDDRERQNENNHLLRREEIKQDQETHVSSSLGLLVIMRRTAVSYLIIRLSLFLSLNLINFLIRHFERKEKSGVELLPDRYADCTCRINYDVCFS